jgi:hypothetical protein
MSCVHHDFTIKQWETVWGYTPHCDGPPHRNFVSKPRVSTQYLPSPWRQEALGKGVEKSSKDCELVWISWKGKDRRVQRGPDSLTGHTIQVSGAQTVTDINSGINSHIEKVTVTVALFAQLQSLDMLSPFLTANAARYPLRFCTLYKSLSSQTDYMPVIWGPLGGEMMRIGSRSEKVQKNKKGNNIISTISIERRARDVTQVVQHIPGKCKALRPIVLHN